MGSITINGKNYVGNNITIRNNEVFIDGKSVDKNSDSPVIKIEGVINNLDCDMNVDVKGEVKSANIKGNLNCDDILGDVQCGGNINCDDVEGNIHAGGNVRCDDVSGNINAGGNIKHRNHFKFSK